MSQIRTRINLSARSFPLVQENWGRTVIVSGQDQNFNRQVQANTDSDHDVGIPQIYYGHNVMPHAQGFQSIGYSQVIAPVVGITFVSVWNILDGFGNFALLGVTNAGNWYVWEASIPVWTLRATAIGTSISTAYCNGKTYIYTTGFGAQVYNFTTKSFTFIGLTGTDIVKTLGLTSSFGYLIAWTSAYAPAIYSVAVTTGSPTVTGLPAGNYQYLIGSVITSTAFAAGTTVLGATSTTLVLSTNSTTTGTVNLTTAGID